MLVGTDAYYVDGKQQVRYGHCRKEYCLELGKSSTKYQMDSLTDLSSSVVTIDRIFDSKKEALWYASKLWLR